MTACARNEAGSADSAQTATIERPEPREDDVRPEELTQTVELDDGRSVDEGAAITEAETGTTVTGTAATTATTTTAPPSKTPPPPRKQ
ncbi:MAG TPA: hypothetical protein VF057_00270, partial [Thermoanaerobaculia bacterium]